MNKLLNNIQNLFKTANTLYKLIYINIAVFLIINILNIIGFFFQIDLNQSISWIAIPADYIQLIKRPWTILSYMFVHQELFHLIFNLLWLYFGGKLFLMYMSEKQLLAVYIISGICGGLVFFTAYNIMPVFELDVEHAIALGASASVLGIVFATSTYSPNYKINLILIGYIKLQYIAIFLLVIDIISIPKGNSGGHLAHLGGALSGYIYTKQLKKGNDISTWFDTLKKVFKYRRNTQAIYTKPKTDDEFINEKSIQKKEINNILGKISKSGYKSLTQKEKEILFRESKK